jgi:hypothetical protein
MHKSCSTQWHAGHIKTAVDNTFTSLIHYRIALQNGGSCTTTMKPICALILSPDNRTETLCARLTHSPLVNTVTVIRPNPNESYDCRGRLIEGEFPPGGQEFNHALERIPAEALLLVITQARLELEEPELQALVNKAAENPDAAMLYSNFFAGSRQHIHPLIPYQNGSIRDDFFFGPLQLYRHENIMQALRDHGPLSPGTHTGLYELRLKVSCVGPVLHLTEPIGCVPAEEQGQQSHFAYVDPSNYTRQHAMETIATEHLKRIGALCRMPLRSFSARKQGWPVEASIVIPVRDRRRTIAEAIQSALKQQTCFPFNVLVVDNYSTDGTNDIIRNLAKNDKRVIHIIPSDTGLGIGGCWNTAVSSEQCGRFVCQLDSDDLYADSNTLSRMIAPLHQGCGMSVGSYRLVNFALEDIPPGIVDHREWTPENGRNNLLRVQGIGAPRAFATELLRTYPFPDVSYGEDYAVALRISRDYRVGRVYEPLYLCRRWEENTDAQIPVEQANRFAFYKDTLRTQEIEERQKLNTSDAGR